MFSASKFTPGLIGVGILWVVASLWTNSWVEKDLSNRAAAAIPADVLDNAAVAVAGRDVTLSGTAFSAAGAGAATSAVNSTSGVRLVHANAAALALAKPYLFNAARDGNKIVLTGNVPDPAMRAKILGAAKLTAPGSEIADQMTYAAGPPAGFAGQSAFAVAELGNFAKANSSLSDTVYSLTGQAASQAGFDASNASLKKLAEGMTLGKVEILPSADAAAKAAADKAVADAAAKAAADKAAADAAAKVAADKAAAAASAAAANATQASAPEENTPLDSKGCQAKLNLQLLEGTIEFNTGKAEINPGSAAFLDLLVQTARRCPKARIEVAGYTDSVGVPENNLALSARRAEAVLAHLVKSGLDASLLTAKGYGEANPVASNDTPEGKAKNRRIEFNVQD